MKNNLNINYYTLPEYLIIFIILSFIFSLLSIYGIIWYTDLINEWTKKGILTVSSFVGIFCSVCALGIISALKNMETN